MRKSIAAGSVLALGVIGATSPLLALPAKAATALPCTSLGEADYTADNENWFQTCVPQFGLGKVEFTISSDVDFPAEFKDLTDPAVAVTTTTDLTAASAYFAPVGPTVMSGFLTSPFLSLERVDDGTNPKLQRYSASSFLAFQLAVFKIASVAQITPAELPAKCAEIGSPYPNAYQVTFEPLDATFTQTLNGEDWSFRILMAPQAQFIGGTVTSGSFDSTQPLCAVQGEFYAGADAAGDSWEDAELAIELGNPYPSFSGNHFTGDFARQAAPALPETGVNASLALGISGMLILAGVAGVLIRRRRA